MSNIDLGRYKRSHQGGNDPKDIIDTRLEEHNPDVMTFPDDIGIQMTGAIFSLRSFFG